jgi:hypothetical protein
MTHNRISNLINSQVPFFVRNDHEKFVTFLEKYYEFLEQDGGAVDGIKKVLDLKDIDLTEDEFAEHLYDTFMKYIPKNIKTDKRLLLKHIKDFYRAKGTEKSIRFLMNALYHAQTQFYYPKQDILKASDGKWYIQRSLRVSDTKIKGVANTTISALEKYVSTRVVGVSSNASATVERVERLFEQGQQIDELILSNIDGSFENGETIEAVFDDIEATSNISSNIFSGLINTITIENGGTNYQVGDPVIIVSSVGEGAVAFVGQVTSGNIVSIGITYGGAGYRQNDNVLVVSTDAGFGAEAYVNEVIDDGFYHPSEYEIMYTTIGSNPNVTLENIANVIIGESGDYWSYTNTGPAATVFVVNSGQNYSSSPSISIVPNTAIFQLGILGRMEIISGGHDYEIGDHIEFINGPGCIGTGAMANVTNVNTANQNAITEVTFQALPGHHVGGSGYTMDALPGARVISNTGNGANIVVTSILGAGAVLRSDQSTIGTITRIIVSSRGRNYDQNTSIDLSQSGDGTANASVSVVEGIITYPGRWLNDDGQLSSYNFLQDRDFYQNFSYVIRSRESIAKYRSVLKNLTHPAGTKMFGEYIYDVVAPNTPLVSPEIIGVSSMDIWYLREYEKIGTEINIAFAAHSVEVNANVGLSFLSGNTSLVEDGIYMVTEVGDDHIIVVSSIDGNTSGNVDITIIPEQVVEEEEEEEI